MAAVGLIDRRRAFAAEGPLETTTVRIANRHSLCNACMMLYPIWQQLPRPRFFPQDPTLDRLLASNYDPTLDRFTLTLRRCEARDLRKGIFGPKGSRIVPKFSGDLNTYNGKMEFDLPHGWHLRLTYGPPLYNREAGEVDADFIPPRARQRLGHPQDGTLLAA